jgi:hypothetical protein
MYVRVCGVAGLGVVMINFGKKVLIEFFPQGGNDNT